MEHPGGSVWLCGFGCRREWGLPILQDLGVQRARAISGAFGRVEPTLGAVRLRRRWGTRVVRFGFVDWAAGRRVGITYPEGFWVAESEGNIWCLRQSGAHLRRDGTTPKMGHPGGSVWLCGFGCRREWGLPILQDLGVQRARAISGAFGRVEPTLGAVRLRRRWGTRGWFGLGLRTGLPGGGVGMTHPEGFWVAESEGNIWCLRQSGAHLRRGETAPKMGHPGGSVWLCGLGCRAAEWG